MTYLGSMLLRSGELLPPPRAKTKANTKQLATAATLRRRTDKSPGTGALERGLEQRPQLAREVVAAEHLLVGRVAVLVQ